MLQCRRKFSFNLTSDESVMILNLLLIPHSSADIKLDFITIIKIITMKCHHGEYEPRHECGKCATCKLEI